MNTLKQTFFRYEDWNDLRLGEFKPMIEQFNPLQFFTEIKNLHTSAKVEIKSKHDIMIMPQFVAGEK